MANIIGKTLLSQFRVDEFIASGGMGTVYRVWDLKRNVPLAMKVLHSELADDPHVFKRFKREANALKKLTHPNIVQFYGLFNTQEFPFLLEEFINGPSLKDVLRQQAGKPLPVQEALTYLKALSSALGYAHASGVVHCDVKSGNVLINQGGNIYLTDFGIARHAESTTTTVGVAGTVSPGPIKKSAIPWLIGGAALVLIILALSITGGGAQSGDNEIGTLATNTASRIPASPTRLVLASPTLITVAFPTATSVPEITCPGAPHPVRFEIDQPIYVCTREETLALRVKPAGDLVLRLLPGSDLTITGGPRCEGNVFWWKVRTESGKVGWVMDRKDDRDEFYICPAP